eukprot:6202180-Pleurochrysis_carterae.AAC.2
MHGLRELMRACSCLFVLGHRPRGGATAGFVVSPHVAHKKTWQYSERRKHRAAYDFSDVPSSTTHGKQ